MNRPASIPTVQCAVSHVPLCTAEVPSNLADGIAIGTLDGHLSIYLVQQGNARFVHLCPDALDVVAGLLADAIGQLTRQTSPSLETVQ